MIADYRVAVRSRAASLVLRREVLAGRAPFGVSGDGKELAQIAMAKVFRPGDIRCGYYRDQTLMLATGMATLSELFAELYGNTDIAADPHSGGRQMSTEFATRFLDAEGRWHPLVERRHAAADLAPVAGHLPRSLGIAYASKLYRGVTELRDPARGFSDNGNEVCFVTVGNGGTAEGLFWETLNAAGVLQVPLLVSVWDDGYGISVPNDDQVTKGSISAILRGFQRDEHTTGIELRVVRGHDYVALCDTYALAIETVRNDHVPAVIHVVEMTQPLGHSASGSHERYKPRERLQFEKDFDPITRLREWMIREGIAGAEELDAVEGEERDRVEEVRAAAWEACQAPMREERQELVSLIGRAVDEPAASPQDRAALAAARAAATKLGDATDVGRRLVASAGAEALLALRWHSGAAKDELVGWVARYQSTNRERFNSHLYSVSRDSPLGVAGVDPTYPEKPELVDARVIILRYFDELLGNDARVFIIGEDVGRLGGVNLEFEGLQAKYGPLRVTDTGIREATILGQGIGTALRGLRPVVDIQYVDYLLYALEVASDDLATLHFRTVGGQKAPVIIRTKGHRLQGIWHTGSPMSMIRSALPGVRVAVPRNMTQAVGFYNTFLRGDDPALVIEVLNGYRLKERVPGDLSTFTIPLGVPETLREGSDVTLVTYGALCRIALESAEILDTLRISAEVIDIRTLDPFDIHHAIARSVKKTGALLVVDEDVPGGASAFILQQILEVQGAFDHPDVPPRTLTGSANRTPVGQDGDYFSKPNRDSIVAAVYGLMSARRSREFPPLPGVQ